MKKIRRHILQSKPVKAGTNFLKKVSLPGQQNVSVYSVLEFFIKWIDLRDIHIRASSLSYTFFLSLFPSAIFIFTLIAYLPFSHAHNDILKFFEGVLPHNVYVAIKFTLQDILKKHHGGMLSLGFVSAMYFSTNGFVSLMKAFNRYGMLRERRSFWKQRLVALILAAVVSISFLVSILLVSGGHYLIIWAKHSGYINKATVGTMFMVMNYLIVFMIVLTIISTVYYLAPSNHHSTKWKFLSPGAILACVIILLTTVGFSYYVNQFNSYNKVYGSIGVIIVVLLLIYTNTYILLLGYEFNMAIDKTVSEIENHGEVKTIRVRKMKNFIIQQDDEIQSLE